MRHSTKGGWVRHEGRPDPDRFRGRVKNPPHGQKTAHAETAARATAAGRSTSAAGAVIVGRGEGDTAALELATAWVRRALSRCISAWSADHSPPIPVGHVEELDVLDRKQLRVGTKRWSSEGSCAAPAREAGTQRVPDVSDMPVPPACPGDAMRRCAAGLSIWRGSLLWRDRHGKEGVAGSSPAEGSRESPAQAGFFFARRRGGWRANGSWAALGPHTLRKRRLRRVPGGHLRRGHFLPRATRIVRCSPAR